VLSGKDLLRDVTVELHILKLEGLQSGAIGRLVPHGSDHQEGVVRGVADAGVFGVRVESGELLTNEEFGVNV
jgi:hypothetical protein